VLAESLPFGPEEFGLRFADLANECQLNWRMSDTDVRKRVVVLVGREDHCLADLLYRWRSGDLRCEIPAVISNHPDLRPLVEWPGIEFLHLPVTVGRRADALADVASSCEAVNGNVIALARYMQIIPGEVCARYPGRIVNIHHSFLPSFAGARPYRQAFERGVKLIGATCRYVTSELDAEPIIERDTSRIGHADTVQDLLRIGRDIEGSVLARGLRWHLEDRVLLNGSRTVVFALGPAQPSRPPGMPPGAFRARVSAWRATMRRWDCRGGQATVAPSMRMSAPFMCDASSDAT
jgi:formyltetrahydrofolate deformylase